MHYLHEIMKSKDSNIVDKDEYKMISKRFNVGKYLHAFYEEEVVNYTAIKGLINEDFYKENYGEIKLTWCIIVYECSFYLLHSIHT